MRCSLRSLGCACNVAGVGAVPLQSRGPGLVEVSRPLPLSHASFQAR
jgi:hypothetical protein